MRVYSTDDITGLIRCSKKIVQAPKKEMKLDRGSFRNDMTLESEDGTEKFSVFMRKNAQFPEDFSIGLRYYPKEGQSFNLLRCNGPHGLHVDLVPDSEPHYCYHVHQADAERINEGNLAERHATICGGYASYEEALRYFIKEVRLTEGEKHFPTLSQFPLFTTESE